MATSTLQGESTSLAPPFHAIELVDLSAWKTSATARFLDHDVFGPGYVVQSPSAPIPCPVTPESASSVDGSSHRLKVLRVDAVPYSAEVVKVETLRNRTDVAFVKSSMGHLVAVDLSGELRVAEGGDPPSPQPAPRIVYPIGAEVIEEVWPDSVRELDLLPPTVVPSASASDESTTWGTPAVVSYGAHHDC